MDSISNHKKIIIYGSALVLLFIFVIYFLQGLQPADKISHLKIFEIKKGESLLAIAGRLSDEGLIRSRTILELYALFTNSADKLLPGLYTVSSGSSTPEIVGIFSQANRNVKMIIPDGASVYDIDKLLSAADILPAGRLIEYSLNHSVEGELFPDTYEFSKYSTVDDVVDKFLANFRLKAEPLLNKSLLSFRKNLILASLIQKEVPNYSEGRLVAGILMKRLAANMPLQVDATICYLKKQVYNESNCYPLKPADFKLDSPYNTYLYTGLPPAPIGSPGLSAIRAAVNPLSSPYWFYLSDPKTGKTIFSETLDEHSANRTVYLRQN